MGKYQAAIINLSGHIYLERANADNPFKYVDGLIQKAKNDGAKFIFIDFHAEATSEKRAMGFYLDGRVSAVFGTHTHVQTADAQILPKGTGYVTDIGMTGVINSILGVKNDITEFEDEDKPKMVDIDKVKDWIFDTFYEDEHDGDYDYGQPYIVCTLDTMEQLLKNFEKTMGV